MSELEKIYGYTRKEILPLNNNKRSMLMAIVGSIFILTIGGIALNQIYKNHQANELIIEKCFENFDQAEEVVVKKDGFWSPVICEKK